VIEYAMNNLIRVSFSKVFRNSIWFFGAMACYRKSALKKIGHFKKDTLTEDMDISLELFKAGYKIVTVTKAKIATEAMPSLAALFKQRMRWYYGALQSLSKNRVLIRKQPSPTVYYLFFNQIWWTIYSFIFFPLVSYQVYYWLPEGASHIAAYIFRWFTLLGPFYVLYKIPEWGLNLLNIFGVLSGIISLTLIIFSLIWFRAKVTWKTIICIFFYFPYTIIMNAIIVAGVLRYKWAKKKYFME
jgi:cellulose synthase/poly-beta-1,6-N-acetylglucosamine synthase-like glycosyltransferase